MDSERRIGLLLRNELLRVLPEIDDELVDDVG